MRLLDLEDVIAFAFEGGTGPLLAAVILEVKADGVDHSGVFAPYVLEGFADEGVDGNLGEVFGNELFEGLGEMPQL